jgi:hypothetical protein
MSSRLTTLTGKQFGKAALGGTTPVCFVGPDQSLAGVPELRDTSVRATECKSGKPGTCDTWQCRRMEVEVGVSLTLRRELHESSICAKNIGGWKWYCLYQKNGLREWIQADAEIWPAIRFPGDWECVDATGCILDAISQPPTFIYFSSLAGHYVVAGRTGVRWRRFIQLGKRGRAQVSASPRPGAPPGDACVGAVAQLQCAWILSQSAGAATSHLWAPAPLIFLEAWFPT